MPLMKSCSKCHAVKQLDEYHVTDKKTGRRSTWCKQCHTAITGANNRKNRQRCAEAAARWRKNNPEKYRASTDLANSKRRGTRRPYREANAARIKAWAAEYRKRKADAIREYGRVYYLANKDAITTRIRECIGRNPELYKQLHKAAKHRRRVRLENSGPAEKFTDRQIFERDGWRCGLCGDPVDPSLCHPHPMSASLDHVLPIAKGGGHLRSNVQCAHLRCNLSKRDRHKVA